MARWRRQGPEPSRPPRDGQTTARWSVSPTGPAQDPAPAADRGGHRRRARRRGYWRRWCSRPAAGGQDHHRSGHRPVRRQRSSQAAGAAGWQARCRGSPSGWPRWWTGCLRWADVKVEAKPPSELARADHRARPGRPAQGRARSYRAGRRGGPAVGERDGPRAEAAKLPLITAAKAAEDPDVFRTITAVLGALPPEVLSPAGPRLGQVRGLGRAPARQRHRGAVGERGAAGAKGHGPAGTAEGEGPEVPVQVYRRKHADPAGDPIDHDGGGWKFGKLLRHAGRVIA